MIGSKHKVLPKMDFFYVHIQLSIIHFRQLTGQIMQYQD